jgi:thiamine pyrophosphate-dependent acetolactate synthase large subunit-like protein
MKASAVRQRELLDRRAVVQALLEHRRNMVVVTGLGSPTYDVAAAGDHRRNFYLWGAMGGGALVGLGLALAQPDVPVVVVTGDGEMLMGLGALATIGFKAPPNLTVIVLDNQIYGETGGQASHTSGRVDLCAVARGCGLATTLVDDFAGVTALAARLEDASRGAEFVCVRVDAADRPRVLPSRDGVMLKARLRDALGVEALA